MRKVTSLLRDPSCNNNAMQGLPTPTTSSINALISSSAQSGSASTATSAHHHHQQQQHKLSLAPERRINIRINFLMICRRLERILRLRFLNSNNSNSNNESFRAVAQRLNNKATTDGWTVVVCCCRVQTLFLSSVYLSFWRWCCLEWK